MPNMSGDLPKVTLPDGQPGATPEHQARTGSMDTNSGGFRSLQTHDSTSAQHHVPDLGQLAQDLNEAFQAAWPKRHQIRYSRVVVLLLSWEDDDLGVWTEIDNLRNVFRELYHFEVTTYEIPSLKPNMEVHKCIMSFLDDDTKDTLRIVYYGGHGRGVQYSTEPSIWFANRRDPSAQFPSGGIQSLLEEADSDVLLLYDCCHSAAVPTCGSQQGGVTEVIAACGYETTAPEVDEHSFTTALIEILTVAAFHEPFSVGWLHSQVLSNLKCWAPKVKSRSGAGYVFERQRRRTPIYSLLSETKPRRSIVLGPLPPPAAEEGGQGPISIGSTSSSPTANGTGNCGKREEQHSDVIESSSGEVKCSKLVEQSEELESDEETQVSEISECAKVLLAVRIDKSPFNKADWVEWMRNVPANARDLHVEGIWDSFSTLVLLRMPIEVWNLLPEHPAYSFVGFATSPNLALELMPSDGDTTSDEDSNPMFTPKSATSDDATDDRSSTPISHCAIVPEDIGESESSTPVGRPRIFDLMNRLYVSLKVHHPAQYLNNKKIVFICGVFNILLSGYIIGAFPEYFHHWYTVQLFYLLPIRCYTYHKRGYHFFLPDLCYIVNLLCMCTIWLFPRSTRLFIGTYCLAFGNNAISITMWRSLMVFHSLEKVTTVFIHVMPCVALHCLVHLLPPDLQQQQFPAIWAVKMLAPSLKVQDSLFIMTIWSTVPYVVWQLFYYILITVCQSKQIAAGIPTSFTWLRKRYAEARIGKAMLSLPESLQEPAFMVLQYIYIVLTSLPCLFWFGNRYASAAFLIAVFSGSVYNGAAYYVDKFDMHVKHEEESDEQSET